jgi:hypothetical protein
MPAVAQDAPKTKLYASFDVGSAHIGKSDYAYGTQIPPRDSSSRLLQLRAGYQFVRFFALEASLSDRGSYSASVHMDCSASPQVQCIPDFKSEVDLAAFGLYGVGMLPIGDRLTVRAGVGFSVRQKRTHQIPVGAPDYERTSNDVTPGFDVGFSFAVNRRLEVYTEWSKFAGNGGHSIGHQLSPGTVEDEGDVGAVSLGARWRF